jgi:hypothetical protein
MLKKQASRAPGSDRRRPHLIKIYLVVVILYFEVAIPRDPSTEEACLLANSKIKE